MTRHVLRPLRASFSVVAMAGALGVTAQLGFLQTAIAGAPSEMFWDRSSRVDTQVIDNMDGTFTYNYTVVNTSTFDVVGPGYGNEVPLIVDWELPWFDDFGVDLMSDITSPFGWSFAIETIGLGNSSTGWDGDAAWQTPGDPEYRGPDSPFTTVNMVLHWYSECFTNPPVVTAPNTETSVVACETAFDNAIAPEGFGTGFTADGSLSGFSITSTFEPVDAPYQASWATQPVRTGDPPLPASAFGVPNSPSISGILTVPVPGTLLLWGIGAVALAGTLRRRRPVV